MQLDDQIEIKRNTLRTDRLDMSFGELMNMYEDGDFFISPEYQRAFRWSIFQQTRFIESVLLGIPIPPIFVAEDTEGKWELVDGLQRISTVFCFFGKLPHLDKNNTKLIKGELVPCLDGITIEKLPIKYKTTIKRSVCRVEIVRWDSNEDMRYELFNRLNTGGTTLSDQEIRNCIFRAYPVDLNSLLCELASKEIFKDLIVPSERKMEEMYLEDLVLRFFAFKHLKETTVQNTPTYLTEYMRDVSRGTIGFDMEKEKEVFLKTINFIYTNFGEKIFRPKGSFALYLFETISYTLPKVFPEIENQTEQAKKAIKSLLSDTQFQDISSTTYSTSRMSKRFHRAMEIFENA